ncbi:DUF2218 domain-containing protein [Burkholderia sp. FERM BP-3421]|jgi:hypothetical protein|uniref:DUF2218 domain-containing protein n=1 Tax=Burkholderia sp. FERM BP-3421 TaxID=1494466 RepID=UPI002362B298|nr:DUF2218 domain-containing protein [Burkholderia sp. FERM BP-3421]WDD94330.1 DUF2218 domain-containing protein [Burkholderia sp. FERM BP-3421]
MLVSTAEITVPQADRVLFKMCKHYAIKVPVVFDDTRAAIDFPYGKCHVTRADDRLSLRCEADSTDKLEQIQYVMDEHLALMARNKQLVIDWQRG